MSKLITFKKIKQEKFTVVDLTNVLDQNLSWKAKGIHLYLMSRPPDWKIRQNDLINKSKDAKTSLMAGLKELVNNKYLYRAIKRNTQKRIIKWMYLVFEQPTSLETAKKNCPEDFAIYIKKEEESNLKPENQIIGSQPIENKPYSNIDNSNIDNSNIEILSKDNIKGNSPKEKEENFPKETFEALSEGLRKDRSKRKEEILPPTPRPAPRPARKSLFLEFWNGLDHTPSHKRPETKVYQETAQQLNRLRDGTFFKFNEFEYEKRQKYKSLDRKWTRDEITQALKNLSLHYKNGYWPENKDKFPRSLLTLIYNSRTGNSFFLEATLRTPKPLAHTVKVEPKNPEIFEMYKQAFQPILKNPRDENRLVYMFNNLYQEVLEQINKIEPYMRYCSFSSHIGTPRNPKPFFRQHVDWIKKLPNLNFFILETDKNYYNSYIGWLEKQHHYNLYPDEKQFQAIKNSCERITGRKVI
jgi:hypothetical protein